MVKFFTAHLSVSVDYIFKGTAWARVYTFLFWQIVSNCPPKMLNNMWQGRRFFLYPLRLSNWGPVNLTDNRQINNNFSKTLSNHMHMRAHKRNSSLGTSLVVQWWRIRLPMQGTPVQSLVRELRSHMPWGN